MNYDHDKYPIIIGAKYKSLSRDVVGTLESAELFRKNDDAVIEIKVDDDYCYFKMNYSTFAFDWILQP